MFADIGAKIKNVAIAAFVLEAVAAVITGIVFCANDFAGLGIPLMFIGPLVAWLSALLLYGFGELIDSNMNIEKQNEKIIRLLGSSTPAKESKTTSGNGAATTNQSAAPTTVKTSKSTPTGEAKTGNADCVLTEEGVQYICARCHRKCKSIFRAMLENGKSDMVCRDCFKELSH